MESGTCLCTRVDGACQHASVSASDGFRVMWLGPSPPAERSAAQVARALGSAAEVVARDLEIWDAPSIDGYSMATEVEAVSEAAAACGWQSFHLVGFSAGATVALAVTRALGRRVTSLVLIEPAYIGDDAWSPLEASWRAKMREVFDLPVGVHQQAFEQAMLRSGHRVEASAKVSDAIVERSRILERDALRHLGFTTDELVSVKQPVLVVTGGRSNERFTDVSARLCAVMPDARPTSFARRDHLSSPQRHEPERLAGLLLDFWSQAGGD
jgi:pimeloyl-ACP methyl ester carboxylesterase